MEKRIIIILAISVVILNVCCFLFYGWWQRAIGNMAGYVQFHKLLQDKILIIQEKSITEQQNDYPVKKGTKRK